MYLLVLAVPPGHSPPWWSLLIVAPMVLTAVLTFVWVARDLSHTSEPTRPRPTKTSARSWVGIAVLVGTVVLALVRPSTLDLESRAGVLTSMTALWAGIFGAATILNTGSRPDSS